MLNQQVLIHNQYYVYNVHNILVGEIVEMQQCCPALVRGEKEVEVARAEGRYPVIDITADVFAITSAPGKKSVAVPGLIV